jgi:hypothetical protein
VVGKRLTPYRRSRDRKDAIGSVYPGVGVAGWIVVEIAERFDPEDTTTEIEWDGDEKRVFGWQYSENVRVAPEECRR